MRFLWFRNLICCGSFGRNAVFERLMSFFVLSSYLRLDSTSDPFFWGNPTKFLHEYLIPAMLSTKLWPLHLKLMSLFHHLMYPRGGTLRCGAPRELGRSVAAGRMWPLWGWRALVRPGTVNIRDVGSISSTLHLTTSIFWSLSWRGEFSETNYKNVLTYMNRRLLRRKESVLEARK